MANQINRCSDCVHPIDESGECLIAKMFEKPVNPEHGCSWRVPIKRKSILTNGDRIRAMTDDELSRFLADIADNCSMQDCQCCPMNGACDDVPISMQKYLKQEVSENVRADD